MNSGGGDVVAHSSEFAPHGSSPAGSPRTDERTTFNAKTMEAFSTQGNGTLSIVMEKSPTTFDVEQTLQTMNGARTVTFDSKTGHLFTMAQERGPVPAGATAGPGGRPPQGPIVPGSFTILMVGR